MIQAIKTYLFILVVLVLVSCAKPGGNSPGSEFMPDMAHSIAYESNLMTYYGLNNWGTRDEYHEFAQPRKPVEGTIPRGFAGSEDPGAEAVFGLPANGFVPYYYGDTEEERTRATDELIDNPYPITDAGLARAKDLYDIYCGICHGVKGDGNGYLVSEDNPNSKYLAQPANFLTDEFVNASNGRYYHSIIYGRNVMGSYKDKLSYEERWQVIHYIRSLQARDRKLEYSEEENTLNDVDVPAAGIASVAPEDAAGAPESDGEAATGPVGEDHGEEQHDGQH